MKTPSPNKIVIFGPYKTGTTAIFYKIARSIPCKTRSLFESMEYVEEPEDEHQWVLAKTILWYDDGGNQPKYETFLDFDKQIYLTRDPRDWLVSATLFMIQQEPSLYSDDYKLHRILNALHQKQINPASLPLRHLIELINELSSQHSFDTTIAWMSRHYQWLPLFEARLRNYLRFKYEDFVDNRLTMIENYLGFPLTGDAEVDDAHDHVPRTRGYGNWMDWFTEEDRDFFRPIFNDYMVTYGYDNAWNLSVDPTISSEHSIDYVIRTVNKRRAVPFVIN